TRRCGPACGSLPPPDRQERPETEAGHTFHIPFRVAAGVLVEKRIDRGGHERTVAAVAASVNLVSRVAARRWETRQRSANRSPDERPGAHRRPRISMLPCASYRLDFGTGRHRTRSGGRPSRGA